MTGWLFFSLFIGLVFLVDLFWLQEKRLTLKKAVLWTLFSISISLLFGLWIFQEKGTLPFVNYLTGYLIEKFLSLDNLFVFLVILKGFKIEERFWPRILTWGIVGAMVTRALFIFFGVYLVESVHPIFYLFGAFLFYTGLRLSLSSEKKIFFEKNRILLFLEKRFVTSKKDPHGKFFLREEPKGPLCMTPLFLALIAIESADLLFAVDSIPAILAITTDPFLVYTSNMFAVLGLRALFFVLVKGSAYFDSFHLGISFVLMFVGFKLLAAPWIEVPPLLSLAIILFLIALSYPLSKRKRR